MKNTVRAHRKSGIKRPSSQVQTGDTLFADLTPGRLPAATISAASHIIAANQIGQLLKFNPAQIKLLALVTEWEGDSPIEYCRRSMLALMNSSRGDMEILGRQNDRPEEKIWAEKFLPQCHALSVDDAHNAGKPIKSQPVIQFALGERITLALFSEKHGHFEQVDFTAEESQEIQDIVARRKISLGEFLLETAEQMTTKIPLTELESAQIQANGLLQILSDTIAHQLHSGCKFEGKSAEDVVDGAIMLVDCTKERLQRAFDATWKALHPQCNGVRA